MIRLLGPAALVAALLAGCGSEPVLGAPDAGPGDGAGSVDGPAGADLAPAADRVPDGGDGVEDGARADGAVPGDGPGGDRTRDGGPSFPLTFDDLPDCDRQQPSLDCIRQLFLPLAGTAWAFDGPRVADAFGANEFAVADGWDLTAHHVLEGNLDVGIYGCFFGEYRYAEKGVAFSGPGCGEMLAAGGHPRALECQTEGIPMANCVDEVVAEEAFDLVVTRATPRPAFLELAAALPSTGDPVFVVGYPAFTWLSDEARASLASLYPLVSYGQVVQAAGRGIVVRAAAYGGNSGGPLLDASGRVLGVMSTLVEHQRARGTPVPAELLDTDAIAVAPDDRLRALVQAAP